MATYLRKRHLGVVTIAACWIICSAFFYTRMMSFDTTPGQSAQHPPETWPVQANKPTLIVFLHPKCTCSRASVTQVAKLQSRFPNGFQTVLVLWQPFERAQDGRSFGLTAQSDAGVPFCLAASIRALCAFEGSPDWAKLPQPNSGELLGYQLVFDSGGRLARRFDAHTSGQAFLYDSRGHLRFAGGLTSSRGDSENGPAFSTLLKVISNQTSAKSAPVFGCSL